jgi:hypothetical protein
MSMSALAAVILAHADPLQVRRLVAALDGVRIFLHCDAKSPREVHERMVVGSPERVTAVPRLSTYLASWSLVDAELLALRSAVNETAAQHIAVLSGSDYPLAPVETLVDRLAKDWADRSIIWNVPLPHREWDTRFHRDGGRWRLRYRFITRNGRVIYFKGAPLRSPIPRRIPAGLEIRAGSQWKIYARRHAEALLRAVDDKPDLVRFWRSTLVPDETFAATMLASPTIVGSDAIAPSQFHPWFMVWPGDMPQHPRWLIDTDFDRLAEVANQAEPKWFARKFSSKPEALLDRIDRELLQREPIRLAPDR